MKHLKIITIISSFLATVILLYVLYDSYWSTNAIRGSLNIANSKKVQLGMNKIDVLSIMGVPDTVIDDRALYLTNNDSYPFVVFSFDMNDNVIEMHTPIK